MQDITAKYGASYREMIAEVRDTLAGFDELFPRCEGREVELAGFVWFQGWNDLFDGAEQHYAENLRHLIDDVRGDLGVADLPVVVAAMGQNGAEPAKGAMKVIQAAQLGMPSVAGYERSVRAFATDEAAGRGGRGALSRVEGAPGRVAARRLRPAVPLPRQRDLVLTYRVSHGRRDARAVGGEVTTADARGHDVADLTAEVVSAMCAER